jgi:hypothetical protein
MKEGRQCDVISSLLEGALIEQLRDELPSASLLQVARMYLRDNGYVAAARVNSRLHLVADEVAKRMPFNNGTGD